MSFHAPSRRSFPAVQTRVVFALAALLVVPVLGACGLVLESEPEPEELFYAEGIHALDAGDFAGAEDRFRRIAARCESGAEGRSALLALTTVHLDLRNEWGRPDEAARFAAMHLSLPDAPAAERSLARTLYLLSVYRGADPVEGPEDLEPKPFDPVAGLGLRGSEDASPDTLSADTVMGGREPVEVESAAVAAGAGVTSDTMITPDPAPAAPRRTSLLEPARRFSECGTDTVAWRGVPDYPGTPPSRWAAGDTVLIRDTGAAGRAAALQTRVNELEAELARIRKLLQGGGGGTPKLRP